MWHNPTSAQIAAQWMTDIETHLEAGVVPILEMGYSRTTLDGVATASALQLLVNQRTDVAAPVVVAGGSSQHWLAALMVDDDTGRGLRTPRPLTLFAGADAATYMATLDTAPPAPAARTSMALLHQPADLATDLCWQFAAATRPGLIRQWEMLPLMEMEGDAYRPDQAADEESSWALVATLLIVTLLILFALIA